MSSKIIYAWVPGLPHLLKPELNPHYAELAGACKVLAEDFKRQNVKRILYYSTQWLSVLGQSVQMRPEVKGRHVDENWYDFASLDFNFKTDTALAAKLIDESRDMGLQVRAVDYDGFPVDTGTIVANRLINPDNLPTAMYSCCVYSDYAETIKIGSLAKKASETLDGVTAVVVVSGLSGRYFTTEIDWREDHIRDPKDDEWNKKFLAALNEGNWSAVKNMKADYCQAAKVDMGLKALAFLEGAGACVSGRSMKTRAYGSVYGTGAAVMFGSI